MTDDADHPPRPRIRRRGLDVGYGRPPRQHQFRPGQSGNPRGRPRSAKNESTILREILSRKIKNRTGDRVRTISVLEGILLRIADDSLKGDIKSAAFLLNRYGAMVSGELQRSEITEDDRQVLEAYAARLSAQRSENGEQ
ncbi:MAG: DUF5681 domain-containing protein [Xanthobacteraceae bacterium]